MAHPSDSTDRGAAHTGRPQERSLSARLRWHLSRPEMLAFIPAVLLAALWFGGRGALLAAAWVLPIAFAVMRADPARPALLHRLLRRDPSAPPAIDPVTGLPGRAAAVAWLDRARSDAAQGGRTTACLVLCLDEPEELALRHGQSAAGQILRRTAERLHGALREGDRVFRLDGARFAVGLVPARRGDLESLIQIAARLKAAAEAPLSVDAATLYVSAAVGFCPAARAPGPDGAALLRAAEAAAAEALHNGPGAIRAFTPDLPARGTPAHLHLAEIEAALEDGQIVAYFQPQLSTDTGEVTGFEALARWIHPDRGVLPPAEFLEPLLEAGLSGRLNEVMLFQSLTALRGWIGAGFDVPSVAVNFSRDELRNPNLAEKIRWELDRFDLRPARLTVEILESVMADPEDEIAVRNVAALARMGCRIDLDDFGTGKAAIANVRRFDVHRLKIDRSFVTKVDCDPGQQRMIAAILSMADGLGLDTLAEGVETTGEHAMLAQLGCRHVQGYAIARPMPLSDTLDWLDRQRRKTAPAPVIGRRAV